jgi:hypothetical protein
VSSEANIYKSPTVASRGMAGPATERPQPQKWERALSVEYGMSNVFVSKPLRVTGSSQAGPRRCDNTVISCQMLCCEMNGRVVQELLGTLSARECAGMLQGNVGAAPLVHGRLLK